MTRADHRAVKRFDRWLDDQINDAERRVQSRRRRGKESMITVEERRTLCRVRDALQTIHREESRY